MLPVTLLTALFACQPLVEGQAAADGLLVDTGEPEVAGTPAPEGGWPTSSICVGDGPYTCDAIQAQAWGRGGMFEWKEEDFGVARLRAADGDVLLEVVSPNWIVPSGLTALPDGGWALTGGTLRGSVRVGGVTVEMPHAYDAFVLWIGADGRLKRSLVREAITSERVLVAARTDGSIVIAGDLFEATTLGDTTLSGPSWVYDFYLAAIDRSGSWLWATELPTPATDAMGDFELYALTLGPESEAIAHGWARGTLVAGEAAISVASGERTAAVAKADERGRWVSIAFAP